MNARFSPSVKTFVFSLLCCWLIPPLTLHSPHAKVRVTQWHPYVKGMWMSIHLSCILLQGISLIAHYKYHVAILLTAKVLAPQSSSPNLTYQKYLHEFFEFRGFDFLANRHRPFFYLSFSNTQREAAVQVRSVSDWAESNATRKRFWAGGETALAENLHVSSIALFMQVWR